MGVPRVRAALARGIVPGGLAAVLAATGRVPTALVLGGVAVAVVLAGLVVPHAASAVDRALAALGAGAAGAVFALAAMVGWALVVLPVWALSALVRASPLDTGWAGPTTAWRLVDGDRWPDGRPVDPARMGARDAAPSPGLRRRRRLRLVVPAVAVLLAALAVRADRDRPAPPQATIDLRPDAPPPAGAEDGEVVFEGRVVDEYAHEDEPWAPELFRELSQVPSEPDHFLGYRFTEFDGVHVDVRDGRRESYRPADPQLTVWFFGGSTTYGIGQRDDHTIPSVVAREAERAGLPIEVLNFGAPGDVAWQEALRFATALTSDLPRPDLVVFYDGANEFALAGLRAEDGNRDPDVIARMPLSEEERERYAASGPPLPVGPERDAVQVELGATQYRRSVELARSLARPAGIPVVHVWQPYFLDKEMGPADEELVDRLGFPRDKLAVVRDLYTRTRERSGVDPVDLSRVLDQATVPVYFDWSHTNELGARLVGEALHDVLAPQLRELAGGR